MRTVFALLTVLVVTFSLAGICWSGHKEETSTVKGTILKIEPSEYEVTVKDDKGKETKVRVKDTAGAKVGEGVVISKGKVTPAVKPRTGGY
jgi:hypothetical protein